MQSSSARWQEGPPAADTQAEGSLAAGQSRAAPSIQLPKGGGAIRGIGEKFGANPVTGTGSMTVPIATSPGRSGFGPQLSLSYDSGGGNGPFGFGWSLSLPTIARKTERGLPHYRDADESDVYVLSGAEDLVPVLQEDGTRYVDDTTFPEYVLHRYRPRVEGLFARIERWTNKVTGAIHWRSITRDNVTTLYGRTNESRVFDPDEPTPATPLHTFLWLISESYDDMGNAVLYEYAAENDANVDLSQVHERNRVRSANRYLKRVKYGNRVSRLIEPDLSAVSWMFEVVFDYDEAHVEEVELDVGRPERQQHRFLRASASAGESWAVRPDPFSSHRAGFEVRTYRRCLRVLMFHHIPDLPTGEEGYEGLVRVTEFDYADLDYQQAVTIRDELAHQGSTRLGSFLRSVTQWGCVRDESHSAVILNGNSLSTYLIRALPPLEFEYSKASIQEYVLDLDGESLENLPTGVDGANYQWVDLDGEGVSGILTEQSAAWFYKPNAGGGRFGSLQAVAAKPSLAALSSEGQLLLDLAGDGQLDLVTLAGSIPGFYERTFEEDWAPFRAFRQLPNVAWDDPNLRFVDVNGDGRADVLISEQDAFTWYPSLAEEGFGRARKVHLPGDEERGPRLVFADGTQSVYLADMCGDGLADLVRIRNGEACYWPNFGYGRFGPKVTMEGAPWLDQTDQFDQRRVRLADIDGSGVTDLIYLHRDGPRIYFNRSGNGWSEARQLSNFPQVDDTASVMTADLLGNGTACLVWSSPLPGEARRPMRYVDLMGGTKPHLLVKSINNLGTETRVEYAPSTRFYLADKLDGRPWVTRLPFPVHVVERVETHDRISGNRFVTRYAYHHGYFDGVEREFRGFGMVERCDTEELAALNVGGADPAGTNIDEASHVPPVLTKSWYHTGAYLRRGHISGYFAGLLDTEGVGEYYREPGLTEAQVRAGLLDDTVLPHGLTVEEEREACRALKGSMLRQEVYALDGTEAQARPYTVTEQNFTVRMVQPRGGNRNCVLVTHPRESISYRYERALVPVLDDEMVDDARAGTEPGVMWRPDPRIAHALTLEVDDFGNIVRSAAIGYGRRYPDLRLPTQADRDRQAATSISFSEKGLTKSHDTGEEAIDEPNAYRTPLPCEACTYELTGLAPTTAGSRRFSFDEVLAAVITATAIGYEEEPTPGLVQKRLIEQARTYYRRNDLTRALPLGETQSLALPFESYKLALTGGLVDELYGSRETFSTLAEMLNKDGRFVHTEGDADWWIPGGQIFYSPEPAVTPAAELAFARRHFFLPHRYRDPFHTGTASTESFVTYDAYQLLVEETRDALGNRVTVGERHLDPTHPLVQRGQDYRILQPRQVMDPNRNRSEAAFDALGMVAGTAVMGKPEEALVPGDRISASFRRNLTQAEIDEFLANPRGPIAGALLDDATTRVVYDLTTYWREPDPAKKRPTVTATITRETHASEPAPTGGQRRQVGFSYSDGFGREIQQKVQAEPGPVPLRDANGGIFVGTNGQVEMTPSDVSPRWVGSGWVVFNNKGQPVRKYEPFFTERYAFERDVRIGVSAVMFYDPIGRVVGALHPDHTWEKVVFDAWRQETWDVNDTALVADPAADADVGAFFSRLPDSEYLPTWRALRMKPAHAIAASQRWPDPRTRAAERRAAKKTSVHAATPIIGHVEGMGRTFLTEVHNRLKYAGSPRVEEIHRTRIQQDIEGNEREVVDANDRLVMRYGYDMLGKRVRQESMEAGKRWTLYDVAGKPLYAWDSRKHRFRTTYDQLRRPTDTFMREGAGAERLVGRTVYGESRPSPEEANLRTKVVEVRDQAGIVTSQEYDFKGNLLCSQRRFARSYKTTLVWSGAVPMEGETYTSRIRYDALNRPIQTIAPHSDQPGTMVNVVAPVYNEAKLLQQLHAWLNQTAEPTGLLDPATADLHVVTDVSYDAKGQRTRIDRASADGRLISTSYVYDRETLRVSHLYTRRGLDAATRQGVAFGDDCDNPGPPPPTVPAPASPPLGGSCGLQNLHYTYDPAGNITHIRDDAQQTVYFNNRRVEPSAEYTYDAVYRLIEATGREHLGQVGGAPIPHSYNDVPRVGQPHPGDGQAMGRYLERYVYDLVGNFVEMQHHGTRTHPGWTRTYRYEEPSALEPGKPSNRLTRTTVGAAVETFSVGGDGYDAHGNTLRMSQLRVMQWDYRDQLRMTRRQAVDAADIDGVQRRGERTWYIYDSAGARVRKVTELPGGQVKDERVYLGGFEIYRRRGAKALVRETLQIVEGQQLVALVETRTHGNEPGVPTQLVRYQFGNHLGSATLELDIRAQIVSYEEFTPFGNTSYQGVRSQTETPKRYRYTGKERDEESGLHYHGARYYASWLGRWISCDPLGIGDGIDPFVYVGNRPVTSTDRTGYADEGVTKIADWLQAFAKSVPEDEWKTLANPEWTSTTPSSRGTRYHTILEAAVAFGWENKAGADIERVLSEIHIDPSGNLVAVNEPPGAALKYGSKRTADLAILKQGERRLDILERLKNKEMIKASDVLDIALDYKTGGAPLKAKQGFEQLAGVPYEKLTKGGDLAGDVTSALQRVGNPIKAAARGASSLPGGKSLATGVGVAGGALVFLKPVAAAAGPAGDALEVVLGAKAVVDAPPEERLRVTAQKTGGFAGGMAGGALGVAGGTAAAGGIAVLLGLSGPPGWLVLALGVVGAGGLGYAGSELGEAGGGALYDAAQSGAGGSQPPARYLRSPDGMLLDTKTGRLHWGPGPKW